MQNIKINPLNEQFHSLMSKLAKSIRDGDTNEFNRIKSIFGEAGIVILYNKEYDVIKLIKKSPSISIDFKVTEFYNDN